MDSAEAILNRSTRPSCARPALAQRGDRHLVEIALAGGPPARRALETLVLRHRGWVERACERRLRCRHDAEDAAQEVMLRMVRGLAGYQGRATVRTWLGTIVTRECASFAARRSRAVLAPGLEALIRIHDEQMRGAAPEPEPHAQVRSSLAELPGLTRRIVELRFFEERALEEIADALELSLSATKMRLYRALERLRDELADSMAA